MRDGRFAYWAATSVIALVAAYGVWQIANARHASGGPPPLPAPVIAESAPAAEPSAGKPSASSSPAKKRKALKRSAPVKLYIPSIVLRAWVDQVGMNPNGTIETPPYEKARRAAWYHPGPSPGEPGAAVILGHVDDKKKVAVFFYLSKVRPGDEIDVLREDGKGATFTVTSIEQFAKDDFPTDRVYADGGEPVLRLVTCGGRYDRTTGDYLDNIVVFAKLTSVGTYRG